MYKNRLEAGRILGNILQSFNDSYPVVLAIPRGGVEVAHHAASELYCDLSVIITQNLKYPLQENAVFGSMAEDESLYLDPWVRVRLSREMIYKVIEREKCEIQRRISLYRRGEPMVNIQNRTVILIDDKITSDSSVFVAINCCRKKNPLRIIVASPAADIKALNKLKMLADEVVIPEAPELYYSAHQFYEQYEKLTDKMILKRLNTWGKQEQKNIFALH
ncbi:MAG: phosphoribosyltransferase family protein [Balneolaceae bacterium]